MIAAFCLGLSLWFLYDATIGYPAQRERALAYKKLDEEDRLEEWEAYAQEQGWPVGDPGKPKTAADIYIQYTLSVVFAVPGLIYAFRFFLFQGRWIELTETGIRTSWGEQLEFDQIASINKKLWKTKGVVHVDYKQDERQRRLILDDWKYERKPTEDILRTIEDHIEDDQILAGLREPPPQEDKEEQDEEFEEGEYEEGEYEEGDYEEYEEEEHELDQQDQQRAQPQPGEQDVAEDETADETANAQQESQGDPEKKIT